MLSKIFAQFRQYQSPGLYELFDNGARGRDRTADTAIFSRMLYQLSYPGFA